MHEKKIYHGDLKTENMLLYEDSNIKVFDFEGSISINKIFVFYPCHTLRWCAPETVEDDDYYTDKSEIYSLGIVIFEIITSLEPYKNNYIINNFIENKKVLGEYYYILLKCCALKPEDRICIKDLKNMISKIN